MASNFYSNAKSIIAPEKVKQGYFVDRKIITFKHRDYDKKTTTYKIVELIPKKGKKIQ